MSVALNTPAPSALQDKRDIITHSVYADERETLQELLQEADFSEHFVHKVHERSLKLVTAMRDEPPAGVEAFLAEYRLDQREGVLIMCLAESLLRIPDSYTADKLIYDKFSEAEWEKHVRKSNSFLVNASSWGLMLTGKIINFDEDDDALQQVRSLVRKTGEPIIRKALETAMEWMGTQFILGRDIREGLKHARKEEKQGYLYSYDILGEGARTEAYADDYARRYRDAIEQIGKAASARDELFNRPSISIKLSALHPRYEGKQSRITEEAVFERLKGLMLAARDNNIMAAIDAEEAGRLDFSLTLFERLIADKDFNDWNGISLVVQAYQKRAPHVIDWCAELAEQHGKTIPVRLVKGAYWDTEIKIAQQLGLEAYPVFTRKHATDLSYLVCARRLLRHGALFYPQFATHNAHTVASITELAASRDAQHSGVPFEFQRLHGMGKEMYDEVKGDPSVAAPCRIYAPIGVHKDLLAYLVRRLLENGANSSFINRLADQKTPLEALISDPVAETLRHHCSPNPDIPLPSELYGEERANSKGYQIHYTHDQQVLHDGLKPYTATEWEAKPLIGGKATGTADKAIMNPAEHGQQVGKSATASEADIHHALDAADKAFPAWEATPATERATILRKAADMLEARYFEAMAITMREAGKTAQDAIDEVREAIDFCRYYAARAEEQFAEPTILPGPTGESNRIELHGRGIFVCISPWNFPLAIFMGQVVAALAAGNSVIAKPAEQTPLIAYFAVKILLDAGVPGGALNLVLGSGSAIGKIVLSDKRVAGVTFTGSTATAHIIQKQLLERGGPIVPFIAETGGQNAMIVDSSALPEQVSDDIIHSAFGSAGQRCSALRVAYIQEDVADDIITMLTGALEERVVGNPWKLETDIGPVIDKDAQIALNGHKAEMRQQAKVIYECKNNAPPSRGSGQDQAAGDSHAEGGSYVTPAIYEIASIDVLKEEHFGPILHIVRFRADRLAKVVEEINATGYGLTLGVHSRIDDTAEYIIAHARVGNIYVNRGMTGAVVGVQPFGGEGLSGTGPKAGGPHYLQRFAVERTVTVNTAAIGGNLELFS